MSPVACVSVAEYPRPHSTRALHPRIWKKEAAVKRLSPEQATQFREEGYVRVPDIFRPDDLEPIRREIGARVDELARDAATAGEIADPHSDEPFERQLARIAEDDAGAARLVMRRLMGKGGGGHCGPALFGLLRHPKLVAAVEDLVGPEIVGSSVYRIRPKVPRLADGVVPWHQDSGYLQPHCDRHLIVTCWIPLVDATPENGCLQVLPGAHRRGILRHCRRRNADYLIIPDEDLLPNGAVTVPVPRGGVLFLTNLTPHCSTPNETDIVRWSIDLRYQSAEVPNNVDVDPAEFPDNLPQVEMACYPPEADFVIQSPSHPEREIRTVEAFEALRLRYERATLSGAVAVRWTDVVPL